MTQEQKVRYWIMCNMKEMPLDSFFSVAGEEFYSFGEKYKKDCNIAWRALLAVKKLKKKVERIKEEIGGIPCKFSDEGLHILRRKQGKRNRKGMCIGERDGKLRVRWDGLSANTIYMYAKEFIELL